MPSLAELADAKKLGSWPHKEGVSCPGTLYYTPEWRRFLYSLAPPSPRAALTSQKLSERQRLTQLCMAFVNRRSVAFMETLGKRPLFQPVRKVQSVWEFSTPTTRTFGWFARPDVFVAVCGARISEMKTPERKTIHSVYDACAASVVGWSSAYGILNVEISSEADVAALVLE